MILYMFIKKAFHDGDRAFPVAAVKTCNSLPSEVTSLKCLQTLTKKLS